MNVKELQIGDLVDYRDHTIKVTSLYDKGGSNEVGFSDREDIWVNGRVLNPIPLTPEILEKNGFVNDFYEDETIADNGAAITFQGYSYHDDGILVTYCNETIHATNDYTDAYIAIRGTSVSLLQHVMRLCGIDKEITLA